MQDTTLVAQLAAHLNFSIVVMYFACFNTGVFLIGEKYGWYDSYDKLRATQYWLPKWCQLCYFFWMATIEIQFWYWANPHPFDWFTFLMISTIGLPAAVVSLYFFNRTK